MGIINAATPAANLQRWILVGFFLLIIGIGGWFSFDARKLEDMRIRSELLRQAIAVAENIEPENIRELSFSAEDADRPAFQRITTQLRTYAEISGIRSLYTMKLRNGQLLFGPENLVPGDPYATPPGTPYKEPSPHDFEVFRTTEPVVFGPVSDEFGEFISAIVPIIDPRSSEVLMVLGEDMEAADWRAQVRKAQWMPLFSMLLPVGLLLLGYIDYKIRKKRSPDDVKYLRNIQISTHFAVLLVLSLIAALLVRDSQIKKQREHFLDLVGIKSQYYLETFQNIHRDLHLLSRFFEASENITPEEFRTFCEPLLRNDPVGSCLWLLSSPDDASDSAGKDSHYPAVYVEPASMHSSIMGNDFYSNPTLKKALLETGRSGHITASEINVATAQSHEPAGLFVFKQVSKPRRGGFVGFCLEPDKLISGERSNLRGEVSELSSTLFELDAGGKPYPLSCSGCENDTTLCLDMLESELSATIPIFAFGKTYTVLFTPGPKWLSTNQHHGEWATLAAGITISLLLTYLFAILLNRPLLLDELIQQRTRELTESEERFKSLHNASFGGIAIHHQGLILECNLGLSMITGYAQEELIGMNGLLLIAEEARDLVMDKIQSGFEQSYEATGLRKNGETYPLRLEARNVVYKDINTRTVEFRDITEQKKAEAELRRLSTAIEQSPETIVITDPEGNIQYANPAFAFVTGYSLEEVMGQNPRILKSEEHPPSFYCEMWKTISNGDIWEGRIVNKRKDGSLYTEEASISPVKDTNGRIVNYVAVKRDITGELVKEEELRQAHKMEAIGQLSGGIAHDFNNILQGILGFSEMLQFDLDESSQAYANAAEIHKSAMQAASLTQKLLTFSRKQPIQITDVDLNNTIHDSEALLHILLGKKHELALDLHDDLPPIHADYGQITQIIMNLAVNARDAMPMGGRLTIATESVTITETDAAYITDSVPGSYLCLGVTDTGCGMDAETKARIFDPFFTTKVVGSGTGLGLSVIYGIVEQSKGWINVYSEPGKGTCFKIFLPVAPLYASSAGPGKHAALPDRNARILFVEDDPEIRSMVVDVLGDASYDIEGMASAEEGLAIFNEKDGRFDLLMSDMELPGMSGDKLAQKLRAMNPELPVLLLSGYQDEASRWRNFAEQGFLFLSKPFTIPLLLDTVERLLREREMSPNV